ncbi:aspartate carbamoyltransferase [Vibrio sp. Vb2880]|uniref:aspartate carbamoyltransferase n=1 Tax=Vibrio TaxID=662 RepID=UPI0012AE25B2|nr:MULTISPECIES: aspartate carbamoyltransferase [Vibrio]MBO0214698.1 aspartate carbamoyltransferase [Vibrio sp. Vb2880]
MAHSLFNRHIISIPEFTRHELELIVDTAARLKAEPNPELLKNKVVASCFFEPSTRTRLSFETAVQRLGGTVIGFDNGGNTSLAKKGETLADSVQVISSYVDAFVMRHPQEGAARLASEFSNGVPVVNGGDGANQHPTQTLLDLFSIYETQGTLDNLNVAFVGDLKYGRTVHSLTQALAKFNNIRFFFIAPEVLAMPDYLCQELEEAGIAFSTHASIEEVVPELDILYMTRVQKERFDESEYAHMKSAYVLSADTLKAARSNLKVLHPLPRVDEITTDVDHTPYAYYFQQAENGVYARQALLALVLNPNL